MCSENFQGMSPKKKKKKKLRISSQILNSHGAIIKKMVFAVIMSPHRSELLFKVLTAIRNIYNV